MEKIKMKKICKVLTIILIMAFIMLTPGVTVVGNGLLKLAPMSTNAFQHEAPSQKKAIFEFDSETYDLSTWTKPNNNGLVSQQVTTGTTGTNTKFHEKHKDNTITDAQILEGYAPYVIINDIPNVSTRGCYTTSAISLSQNAYYIISVKYYLIEQKNKDTNSKSYAFGTFYLNDIKIDLLEQNKWATATFYVTTDKLEEASVTPELYFGSRNGNALGGIYFDKFTVSAVNQKEFNRLKDERDFSTSEVYDFTRTNDYVIVDAFSNTEFTPSEPSNNAASYEEIFSTDIPTELNFKNTQDYFHNKDGNSNGVMLMRAVNSNATLTLSDYSFQPKSHEVYMFQFYSIATTASDFTGFYFKIGDTPQQITNLTDYPYYNGWQLNTVFFIAGQELDAEYDLEFTLSDSNTTQVTGWVCLDDFKIYKVNGSYATDNASALGVHGTYDQNAEAPTLDIANSNFDLGSAANTVNIENSSYPYPLVADSWKTNSDDNGIVNLHPTLWDERFGTNHPGLPKNSNENNHVYMMHNTTPTNNMLTSPILTTTVGSTTYISFDAYSNNETKTKAYILTAETDNDGNLTQEIVFNETIEINDGAWQHYEFAITENEFASSRNYYLRFFMTGTGYAYIDNVRTNKEASNSAITTAIDLTNTLSLNTAWQSDEQFACNATPTGLTLENIDSKKTTVKNTFGYNLTLDNYYELSIEAYGKNAHLSLTAYDGLLEVTTDEIDPDLTYTYKLYLQAKDGATSVNLQITLGNVNEDDNTQKEGKIFIENIQVKEITEDEFNFAKENAVNDERMKVLSVLDENETEENNSEDNYKEDGNFFGENWWYLLPSLITAIALFLGVIAFLWRKIKFDKHITKKHTSYARDMRLKNQRNKLVAQKATKVDNITDESQSN